MLDPSLIFRLRTLHRRPAILCALLSLLFICPQIRARSADPDLRKALAERAAFGPDQIAALERGEPVAKLIPSNDPREVAVCGVIENHLRANALASSFSKFKHKIVEGRATEDLKNLLGQTRLNIDVVVSNSSPSFERTLTERISESRALQIISWLVLLKVIGTAFYFTFRRKMPRSRRPASNRHSDQQPVPGRALRREPR